MKVLITHGLSLLKNDKKTASDNGLSNAFTGTPGTGVNTQPTLKVLPRFTSDGKADSIELVYTTKVSAAMGVVNLGSNTFQSVPILNKYYLRVFYHT